MKLPILVLSVTVLFLISACNSSAPSKLADSSKKGSVQTQNSTKSDVPKDDSAVSALVVKEPLIQKLPKADLKLSEAERFKRFVAHLKVKAKEKGISQKVIDESFVDVKLQKKVIASDKNQLEKKVTLDDYLKRVLTETRINRGRELFKENREKLDTQAKQFKVPAQYIAALWGMESSYGRLQGKEDVISALTTLAFEGRREAFFTKELMAALEILQQGHIGLAQFKGSWAGAMGQCQFMPSSFLSYGADGSGDGKVDIWNNIDDVFASTASYLSTVGWNSNIPWGREVTLPKGFKIEDTGLDEIKAKTVTEWRKSGVTLSVIHDIELNEKAWIILPDDLEGRAFLVYSNFKTLMDWNRSYYFGISVGMLADSIVQ